MGWSTESPILHADSFREYSSIAYFFLLGPTVCFQIHISTTIPAYLKHILTDLSSAASSLCVLSADLDTPVVSDTPVCADSLQSLEILAELAVETVGEDLQCITTTMQQ